MKTFKPIVFFDGECNLCNSSVDFIVRHDKNKIFLIASLQGKTAQALLPEKERLDLDSLILHTGLKNYKKSDAVLRILIKLRWWFKPFCVFLLVPEFIRDSVYSTVAQNRFKWFGKKKSCRLPTKDEEHFFLP